MVETKPKNTEALRTPKPKKNLGLTVPHALRLPHDDLIVPDKSNVPQATMTSLTSQTRHSTENKPSAAPRRDYTKVANSIGRQAVPAGLFTGKSKQLYDCLYSMTRGAIVPTRTVRISRPKLMKKAHIGSRATFEANIERLVNVGLITVRKITGEHEGNEYTINLPEEATSIPSQTSLTSLTRYAQKLVRLVRLETSQTSHSSSPMESNIWGVLKTSFKTNTKKFDDEAFAEFTRVLQEATKEVTGKPLSATDKERLGELGELLVTELKIAAARTSNVSSVPAFLTEHLRRRLWKMDKRQLSEEEKEEIIPAKPAISSEQARNCPDCGGSGMYYPDGYEKGVAKCRHEQLTLEENSPATE